jgi:hypothetical protein
VGNIYGIIKKGYAWNPEKTAGIFVCLAISIKIYIILDRGRDYEAQANIRVY